MRQGKKGKGKEARRENEGRAQHKSVQMFLNLVYKTRGPLLIWTLRCYILTLIVS